MKNIKQIIKNFLSSLSSADIPMKSIVQKIIQYFLAIAYPLWPSRIKYLPGLLWMTLRYLLCPVDNEGRFPPVETALKRPNGLLLVGGKLTSKKLVEAYRKGIYPQSHIGPIKWWAPDYRMVLFLDEIHIGKNLRYYLRRKPYKVTFDRAFFDVILACAEPRRKKTPLTWINQNIVEAYCRLFEDGYAHSVEVWDDCDKLIAGSYGLAIGRIFFGESSFTLKSNASKIGLVYLHSHLQDWGYILRDVKKYSQFFKDQGARLISRPEFNDLLLKWRDEQGRPGPWRVDKRIDVGTWNPKQKNFL